MLFRSLQAMIEVFSDLWSKGVDYIDPSMIEEENRIVISVLPEYMTDEVKEKFEDMDGDIKDKLTDEDIRDLL